MKRIALITDGIWPYVLGGMQKHSYYLCKYFAKNGIIVDLYHFNQSNLPIEELSVFSNDEKQNINSIILKFPEQSKGFGHYIKDSYKYSELVYEQIKSKLSLYDFMYTKGFSGWKLLEEKQKGNISCCKIGVKFHGYEMFQEAPDVKSKIQQMLLLRNPVKEISNMADVVFSYGGKITEIIKSIGINQNKIIELPSGVESANIEEEIILAEEQLKFVYLGRYERRKGVEELNAAIRKTTNELNAEFHFIGPIPDNKKIGRKNVVYHGEIRDLNKLNNILKSCDVLICPSKSEGLPNVILEAMSKGLAVLATDVGATSVLVSSKMGWLIESTKRNQLLNKLIEIESLDKEIINIKKRNALRLIRNNFNWEKLIPELIEKISKKI